MIVRGVCSLAAALTFMIVIGCGDSKTGPVGSSAKDPLNDLGQALKALPEEQKKPPAKLAELETFEPFIPLAGPQIRSGEIVYLWGAEYSPNSQKIAAHEKKAPTDGGWVLLQDTTVKQMTAEEFKAAPKAK